MPRINRTTVEFEVDGNTYHATFRHVHNDNAGVVGPDKTLGRHLTTCYLRDRTISAWVKGEALCSFKDEYDWKKGVKIAFQRTLEKMKFCEWSTEKKQFIPTSDKYGKFMNAFFTEMSYAPDEKKEKAATSTVLVEVIDLTKPKLLPPGGNVVRSHDYIGPMHGMGWTGD